MAVTQVHNQKGGAEVEPAIRVCGELPRQSGEIFAKLARCETTHFTSSDHSCTLCFALVQNTQAVNPPPDGGYAGSNTAEGINALFRLTTRIDNSAFGFQALYYNTTGHSNTAEGFRALFANTTGNNNTANGHNALYTNTTGDYNAVIGL